MKPENPSLAQLLQIAIDARMNDVCTCMPGTVVSYNRVKQTASIQPSLKRKYANGDEVLLPIVNSVPVVFPRSGGQWVHFDLKKDDVVTLIFSQRSLDIWKKKGGAVTPNDPRKFNLSDAYAMPGGYPEVAPFTPNGPEGSIEFANGANHVVIEKDGKVKAKNGGGFIEMSAQGKFKMSNNTNELFALLVQLTDILSTTTTNTIYGPMKLNDFALIAEIKAKLETLKG